MADVYHINNVSYFNNAFKSQIITTAIWIKRCNVISQIKSLIWWWFVVNHRTLAFFRSKHRWDWKFNRGQHRQTKWVLVVLWWPLYTGWHFSWCHAEANLAWLIVWRKPAHHCFLLHHCSQSSQLERDEGQDVEIHYVSLIFGTASCHRRENVSLEKCIYI